MNWLFIFYIVQTTLFFRLRRHLTENSSYLPLLLLQPLATSGETLDILHSRASSQYNPSPDLSVQALSKSLRLLCPIRGERSIPPNQFIRSLCLYINLTLRGFDSHYIAISDTILSCGIRVDLCQRLRCCLLYVRHTSQLGMGILRNPCPRCQNDRVLFEHLRIAYRALTRFHRFWQRVVSVFCQCLRIEFNFS